MATVTWQEWQAQSQAGEVCGILGCPNEPRHLMETMSIEDEERRWLPARGGKV